MGKRTHSIFLFILLCLGGYQAQVFSQLSNTEKSDFLDAEYYFDQGDYQKAVKLYVKLLNTKPDNANFNYRAGQSYMNIPGEEDKALPYLEKAVKNVTVKYTAGSFKTDEAPAEAWILLGDSYHRINRLDDASNAFNKYLTYMGNDKVAQDLVYQRINGLAITRNGLENPAPVEQKNLGGIINSKYSDYNPVLSDDQKTLVFTSFRDSKDHILVSYYANGSWSSPLNITSQLGSSGNFYTTAISADGNELYLSNYDPVNADIYVAKKERGRWSKCNPLEKPINSKYNETSVAISKDGNTIFFASDRPGGKGGFDIYYSTSVNGKWSKPVNLGGKINTAGDEEWPYITPDGNTLYFSSDGHETIGKMDILMSQRDQNNEWGQPVNLGVPYNTPDDELAYEYFPDTHTGYISRNLPNGFGKKDLYVIVPKEKSSEAPLYASQNKSTNNETPVTAFEPTPVEPVTKTAVENTPTTETKTTLATEQAIPEPAVSKSLNAEPSGDPGKESATIQKTSEKPVTDDKALNTAPKTEEKVVADTRPVSPSTTTEKNLTDSKPVSAKTKTTEKSTKETKPAINEKSAPQTVQKTKVEHASVNKAPSTEAVYTIQLVALRHPVDISRFSKLDKSDLRISLGDDGFNRCTYGEFVSLKEAARELRSIVNLGYKNAFVKQIKDISNYSNE